MANLVRQYLQAQSLEVLIEAGLEDAVMRFVDKDDKDAIKEYAEQFGHLTSVSWLRHSKMLGETCADTILGRRMSTNM